jgi:hypothetical protein
MKTKFTEAAREERVKKSIEVRRAWQRSGYEAVIKHFRDNKDLEFVNAAAVAMRRLESSVISDLMELDDEVTQDDIGSCVLTHLLKWSECIGIMARMLKNSSDRAWEELDKVKALNQESS